MRLSAVHVPRAFKISAPSPRGSFMDAGAKPRGVYIVAGAQILSAVLLAIASASGFESSLGDSQTESLGMALAITGVVLAAGLFLQVPRARLATLVWVCALMTLQLALYARDDSPDFIVMALCLVQVLYLNQSDVKQALIPRPSTGRSP